MMTLYAILGVSEIASQAEVKTAYKKLALIYHPDKNPDNPAAEEFFKEINKAYQVLGNPYRRSTYDMQLRLGYTPIETVYEQPAYEQPPPYARGKRMVVDYKENWIATGYAFLFTLVVAVIVLIFIGIKHYYDDMKMDQKLTQRREVFLEAKTLLNRGQISASLDLINGLGGFYKPEAEIADFKIDLLNKINYDGYINFQRSNFHEALYYFEILQNQTEKSNMPIKEMMAIAYKKTNQLEKAIEILEGLLLSDYRFIFTYLELAEIYQDHLKNPVSALKYLELGNEKAKSYYETIYGKAYPLMISSSNLPEIHFTLYTRLAQSYLTNNDPDKALRAVRWNIQVWPDRSENYAIAARAHAMKNEMDTACFWLKKAKNLDKTCCLEDFCQ